jgi:hypothetical protein
MPATGVDGNTALTACRQSELLVVKANADGECQVNLQNCVAALDTGQRHLIVLMGGVRLRGGLPSQQHCSVHAASLSAVEISVSVAFSASLTGTPPMPRNPPSLEASATFWLI